MKSALVERNQGYGCRFWQEDEQEILVRILNFLRGSLTEEIQGAMIWAFLFANRRLVPKHFQLIKKVPLPPSFAIDSQSEAIYGSYVFVNVTKLIMIILERDVFKVRVKYPVKLSGLSSKSNGENIKKVN